jgi:HAE1 family hydrophobic/amphiphilic exporter-1
LLSQALTLFTTPVIYLYLDRVSVWLNAAAHNRAALTPTAPQLVKESEVFGRDFNR